MSNIRVQTRNFTIIKSNKVIIQDTVTHFVLEIGDADISIQNQLYGSYVELIMSQGHYAGP